MKPTEQPACKYVAEMEHRFHLVHEYAREHLRQASEVQKHYYDMQTYGKPFRVGDVALLYQPLKQVGKSPKLQCFWKGPFVVTRRINDVNYELRKDPKAPPQIVHYNRMRRYKGECDTSWAEMFFKRECQKVEIGTQTTQNC